MKAIRFYVIEIFLLIVAMAVSSCASPTSALPPAICPTSVPLVCPTGIIQPMPTPNEWRLDLLKMTNVVITFDPGDKCSLDVRNPITSENWAYEIIVNDQAYQNYVVSAVTLDAGKTLKDLQDYDKSNNVAMTNPPWSQLKLLEVVGPLSSSWHGISLTGGPLYFGCLVQGPEYQTIIDEFGPVEIVQ